MIEISLPTDVLTQAEAILSRTRTSSVAVASAERIGGGGRANVFRLHLREPLGDSIQSVILKRVRATAEHPYEPDAGTLLAWTFFNEWASLQTLGEIADLRALAPRFYGGDRTSTDANRHHCRSVGDTSIR